MGTDKKWAAIAENAQDSLNAKIPVDWRLAKEYLDPKRLDVSGIPAASSILSPEEIDITIKDATAILEKIHTGVWSAEQVCLAFCKRAAIAQQLVNCLTEICFDEALEAARKLDKSFNATGKLQGPLHGLPISIKDHVNVAGLRSTLGYCCWADNIPSEDSVLVKALKGAGAIVFVKTTMPVTGMAIETVSQLWGRTLNGFNRSLVSGGSSGGEGSLVGLYGSPMGIGTDIGGSIRVPCAFNGIYGIRPSTRRLSYEGMTSNVSGSRTIAGAIGPMCHSVRDIELLCKVVTDAQPWLEDIGVVPLQWQPRPPIPAKLTIGILSFDGVVMPHPPVLRGLDEVVQKLRAAGHEVIDFAPYQHQRAWDIAYPLYYATGGKEMQALLDTTSEPWPPAAAKLSANPSLRELTATELYKLHAAQDQYKKEYLKHWNSTAALTASKRPIDALLCPINPCASYPHDFLTWWGYATQWNLLDYPGTIIPVGFVDQARDLKDDAYQPINDLDKENHDLYNPSLWHGAPISVQLVGKPFEDERLLAPHDQTKVLQSRFFTVISMLDIEDFVKERGGDPEKIKVSQTRRGESAELVDKIVELWHANRKAQYDIDQIGNKINALQKEIGNNKKSGTKETLDESLREKSTLQKHKKDQEEALVIKQTELRNNIKLVGNYVDESVPVSQNENDNVILRTWEPKEFHRTKQLSHHEVLIRLDGYDSVRGVKLAGHRGYCLTGYGMLLNMALINYGVEFLFNKGYTPNQPPFLLDHDQMAKTAQLSQFDEELYHVSEDSSGTGGRYLIATSEQPLSCLHSEEWLTPSQLPIKYAGYSTCFRKEAGSHGRDTWGVFRVHQFEKVEQFILCKPEDSWKHFDEMIGVSEEFYQSLGLSYRVVSIVSGALNNAGSKKLDLEAYFPFQREFKELVSCTNCTDYQTRELEIRYGTKKNKSRKEYVHALNCTLCATERAMCCVLENYQTDSGLVVPEVLRRYIPGQPEFLPFTKEL